MTTSLDDLLAETKLRYTTDRKTGYTRKVSGKEFTYFNTKGEKISDEDVIDRINKLTIPPAWEKVWISPFANGHLQATGYDRKKRKQYRYHPLWVQANQEAKFEHLAEFGETLPEIRKRIRKDMELPGMPREKVLATVVWLLENTLIRVGNEEYVEENKSYGLTTLKNRHVDISKNSVMFAFKGKSGVYHNVKIRNKKVAKIIRRCKEIPGQDLFEYKDENGDYQHIDSYDVNAYLKEITDKDITAKDFRTWGGTIIAASLLGEIGTCDDEKESKQYVVDTVKKVSIHLRNKPTTSRKYYIHPMILDAFSNGKLVNQMKKAHKSISGLDECENTVLNMLKTAF